MNVNPGNFDKKIQIVLPAEFYQDEEGFESVTEPQYDDEGFEIVPDTSAGETGETATTGETGETTSTNKIGEETVVRTCWAQITYQSGREIIESESEFDDADQRFLVRWSPTEISTDMFVRYAGHDYDIEYVHTYGDDKKYTEIWTKRTERV